jgi:hypothetical protein
MANGRKTIEHNDQTIGVRGVDRHRSTPRVIDIRAVLSLQ